MVRTALFRADASAAIGGGHVRRCLVLADALRAAGWDCVFAVAPGTIATIPQLGRSAHRVVEIAPHDCEALPGAADVDGFDLAVIDHYELDATFERHCRNWADRILVIDDLADRPHDCDVLVDATPEREGKDYRALVGGSTQLLLGPAYALLDARFFSRRLALAQTRRGADRFFVSFGAVDRMNASEMTLSALRTIQVPMQIDIVVGTASPNIGALRAVAAHGTAPARIMVDVDDVSDLMARADIAIGAAGGTSYERCCLGLPSLILTVADNQGDNARALERCGAARWLGDVSWASLEMIAAAVRSLITDGSGRAAMRNAALAVTDGLGANRVLSAVTETIVAKDGRPVTLRPVRADDCATLFAWQTEPGARQYSRNPQPPTQEEHRQWFEAKLADPQTVFSMVLHDRMPAGVLRYDWRAAERRFEVSILIGANEQGRGIASAALALGKRLLPDAEVVADVDPANSRSMALFERAGYRRIDQRRYVLAPARRPDVAAAGAACTQEALH